MTHVCVPCAAGTSQLSGASLACKPCKAGALGVAVVVIWEGPLETRCQLKD